MIQLGEYNTLEILKSTPQGLYLTDEEKLEEILLPNRYVTEAMKIGESIKVFLYNDSEDRLVATTEDPLVTLDNFAVLTVKTISEFGAFVDWGLAKDLLVPFSQQLKKLHEGNKAVVMLYLDKFSNRLAGTTNLKPHLNIYDIQLKEEDEVELLVFDLSDLGAQVIINNEYIGLVYNNEIFQTIEIGDKLKGYVKKIRDDKRIDISLQKSGYAHTDSVAERILEYLESNEGFMTINDKSDPEEIQQAFQISKKAFKKAIGTLYKFKKIIIQEDGIYIKK